MAEAFMGWARRHPGLYPATVVAPVVGDVEDERASADAVQVIYAVLEGYGLDDERKVDVTRSLRAALHGFVGLRQAGGFAMERSVDDSLGWLIGTFDNACNSR
nr:TetR-like C-terminal domain-containing protein [Spelaeicoccus albus]